VLVGRSARASCTREQAEVDSGRRGRLSTVLGQLPDGVDIPDGGAAGLLLSQVGHPLPNPKGHQTVSSVVHSTTDLLLSQVIHFLPPQAVRDTFTHAFRCGLVRGVAGGGARSVVGRGFGRVVQCV
jgi:hypothetical protein